MRDTGDGKSASIQVGAEYRMSEGSGQMSITKQITVLKGKVRCYYND